MQTTENQGNLLVTKTTAMSAALYISLQTVSL